MMDNGPPTLGPVIRAVARKAENIYSKMAIRRDESEDLGRKKKDSGDGEAKALPWEDTTEVSITALRGFLEDLLGVQHEIPMPPSTATLPAGTDSSSGPSAAARAANAYQTTGRVVHDHNVDYTPPPHQSSPTTMSGDTTSGTTGLTANFSEEERARLKSYLLDLENLEQRGISTLTLRRSLTFLESVHLAIEDQK